MDEALIKKVMPHSEEAEQSVIGSMIMDGEAIVTAMEILVPGDFYGRQYGPGGADLGECALLRADCQGQVGAAQPD